MPWKTRKKYRGKTKWNAHGSQYQHHGLRQRLTFAFAFVALAAVALTTWLTLGAVYQAQQDVIPATGATRNHPNLQSAREAFKHVTRTAFTAGIIAFMLASFAAAGITRWLTRPLKALTEGAQKIQAGERGIELHLPPAQDELRSLTEAFNNLVKGLEQQEQWRKNMVADIAHDLRTPLAVMRSELEGMQDGIVNLDHDAVDRLHAEVAMLTRLVNDLRTLSLVESGGLPLNLQSSYVEVWLERIRQSFQARAELAGSCLKLELPSSPLLAKLDTAQMTRVVNNLIDNAIRHASPTVITIMAKVHHDQLLIAVRDEGPGIDQDTQEQIFERFYRGDSSRTSRKDGSGLGLAIASAIVVAHGGEIKASNHPLGGALFEIILPYQ